MKTFVYWTEPGQDCWGLEEFDTNEEAAGFIESRNPKNETEFVVIEGRRLDVQPFTVVKKVRLVPAKEPS